ncbi:MAG: transketolase [Sphingobacteriia bacterium 24-36-13]|jgi:transketolase|uniref:transketolase n=1 Tax=Sediminibacterium sp. TaxID=1917865 RepID=UPI000BC68932|nr:transketolase [Sediminibacterium sp.]OYY12186.1 MAG: transketolase [Sphingobacteriia bacterium 35-36-14]OYZ54997.1 MAG: transketolase [Sphingobacteriia bacterium 24-36-13]OZA66476.1 MAG: transketolase [Sphingobacteriia bacterium 39-36-14]HQS23066.1 transketolase [Sediminibacterium sp.]HQS33862.1 transketolase [Sediminibacterium sp.]
MASIADLKSTATQVRRDIVRMVHGVQSGHPGGSLGCTDVVTALYFHSMKHDVHFSMDGKQEDLFFLSNGHISPLYYSVLARAGYFEVKELASFRKINTRLQGHPTTHEHLPGVRIASGSLGQGLSVAVGAALTKKLNQDPHLVFSLHGDGELQEGQIWEAVMFASHNKVDNLISIVDLNGQQIDGPTSKVLSLGNLRSKFEAFDWTVLDMEGNDMDSVVAVLDKAKSMTGNGKPICILMKTEMGKGVDFMEGSHEWHGIAPSDEQLAKALAQLPETLGDY